MTEIEDRLAPDEPDDAVASPISDTHAAPDRSKLVRRVVLLLCIAAVLGVYYRCATSYGKSLDPAPQRNDFQNVQAYAFIHGHLNLLIEVPPGLKALPDPYDPVANAPYRGAGLHDLSYFDGKLYTYYGPAPVLLLYIPYRLLFSGWLSPTLACLIFCAGGFLASVRAFQHTARRFLGPLSLPTEAAAVIALGLAGPMAWMIYIGRGYEASIACGYFMVSVGLLFLSRALFMATRHPLLDLALAGVFLAGAIGARPSLVWTMTFVAFAVAFIVWGPLAQPIARRFGLAALLAPCLIIAVALAWYNWARFGSVSEFGTSYQMLGENVRLARSNEFGFLREGIFQYLFSPARHGASSFPWLRLRPYSYPQPTEQNYLLEPVAGLVPNMPAAAFGVVTYFVTPWRYLRTRPWLTLFIVTAVVDSLLTLALISYHQHGATMRYELDFAPPLLFASVLGGVAWLKTLDRSWFRWVASGAAVVAVAWSVFFVLNITGYPCAGTGSC